MTQLALFQYIKDSAFDRSEGYSYMTKVLEKTCPYCYEKIKSLALKCKHCGMDLFELKNCNAPRCQDKNL